MSTPDIIFVAGAGTTVYGSGVLVNGGIGIAVGVGGKGGTGGAPLSLSVYGEGVGAYGFSGVLSLLCGGGDSGGGAGISFFSPMANGVAVSPTIGGMGFNLVFDTEAVGIFPPGALSNGGIDIGVGASGGHGGMVAAPLQLAVNAFGAWPPPVNYISVAQSPGYALILSGLPDTRTGGQLMLTDHASARVTWSLLDTLVTSAPVGGPLVAKSATSSVLTMGGILSLIWNSLITEHVLFTPTVTPHYAYLLDLVDTLKLHGGPKSGLAARNAVAAALALHDTSHPGWANAVTEHLHLSPTFAPTLAAYNAALDHFALTNAIAPHLICNLAVVETFDLDDASAAHAAMRSALLDGLGLSITIHLGDDYFSAWVLNTDTLGATTYRNYAFNSFAGLFGRYFGATDTGIYELTGDTDAGAPIEAWIRSGLSNVGTGKMKRMPSMYLGYTATGAMVLKVITTSPQGAKVENWYQMVSRPATDVRESRIKIGRGLKSVYWGFELHNVAGDAFSLRDVELFPIVVDRRI